MNSYDVKLPLYVTVGIVNQIYHGLVGLTFGGVYS